MHCLLVFPQFTANSFWNYRAACELKGAKYPATPLGLITVAALLPSSWECRLVDCNVEPLEDEDIEWADIIMLGAMISQQFSALALIDRLKSHGKTVVVGGPDATSSPHLYDKADFLVLGEAEITLPRWLGDFEQNRAEHVYSCDGEMADMSQSPVPRFDLLKLQRYLHVGVQFARGCPFNCEFCDIIVLFGRVPRLKSPSQLLRELDELYRLGYRGHVDFVDDNFIGNKKQVKQLLPKLRNWQQEHRWPFEFSTEASINLGDDDELMKLMEDVGFFAVFVGVETPDVETLKATQKKQNTRRPIAESIKRIYSHGIFVNSGYILGFDTEPDDVADRMLALIADTAVPVNMVGLLFALPRTQLARRLAAEGRLRSGFEVAPEDQGDQCTAGLNFVTKRPRMEILADYRRILTEAYEPHAYMRRVLDLGSTLDCSSKKLRLPLREQVKDWRGFLRLIWRMGVVQSYRAQFWRTLTTLAWRNPRSLRYTIGVMALYLHFSAFGTELVRRLDAELAAT